ncbi:MAG: extracellular solute-binding protein [Oscillospiraceae bacterium]|nr:extracellular solute-binding protein [Oscillospiraceae bacterium]
MKKMKRLIALVLAFVMILTLAACGGGGTVEPTPGGIGGEDEGTLREEGYVFVPEFIDIDVSGQWPSLLGIDRDTLYLSLSVPQEGELGEFAAMAPALATMEADGTGFELFWTGTSEQWEEGDVSYQIFDGIGMTAIRPEGGLLAIRQYQNSFWSLEDWGVEEGFYLMAFTADGTVEREADLSAILPMDSEFGFGVTRMQVMSDGRIVIGTWDKVYVLSPDWTLEIDRFWGDEVQSFVVTENDELLVSVWDNEDMRTQTWHFDLEAAVGSEIQNEGESVFAADVGMAQVGGEYGLYIGTSSAVFGFDMATGRSTQLFDWIDVDMLSPQRFVVSDTGDILFLEENWDGMEGGGLRSTLVRLSKQDAAELPAVTEIVYGGLFIDFDIRREIIEFNRRNTGYRIRVREYADWLAMDQTEAIRRLNTDIITGNAPDILDFGMDLPFEQYARRGFLADIGTFLDADAELSRGSLVESVMDLLAVDGTLYTVLAQFTMQTLVGRSDLVGADMGWTMDEFLHTVATMPTGGTAFGNFMTRQSFMNSILGANLGLFVDRETGTANFDSPLFMEYLAFAHTLPTEEELWGEGGGMPGDWARPMPLATVDIAPPIGELPGGEWDNPYATGQVLLTEHTLWGFNDLSWIEDQFGGAVTLKGYPSEQGIGSAVVPRVLIGISAGSQHQDAAWSFVRTLLTERWQRENVGSFATNRAVLEGQATQALENARAMTGMPDMEDMQFPVTTEAQIAQINALIQQVDLLAMRDGTVLSMIEEETLAFFAGDRSLEETVRIIQSRVQTYLSERG